MSNRDMTAMAAARIRKYNEVRQTLIETSHDVLDRPCGASLFDLRQSWGHKDTRKTQRLVARACAQKQLFKAGTTVNVRYFTTAEGAMNAQPEQAKTRSPRKEPKPIRWVETAPKKAKLAKFGDEEALNPNGIKPTPIPTPPGRYEVTAPVNGCFSSLGVGRYLSAEVA